MSEKLFSLYVDRPENETMAYLEVTFPDFGMPVLYEDCLNLGLRQKYHFPSYLVEGYQTFAENINRHQLDDPAGRDLSCLASYS